MAAGQVELRAFLGGSFAPRAPLVATLPSLATGPRPHRIPIRGWRLVRDRRRIPRVRFSSNPGACNLTTCQAEVLQSEKASSGFGAKRLSLLVHVVHAGKERPVTKCHRATSICQLFRVDRSANKSTSKLPYSCKGRSVTKWRQEVPFK
jgi:hypothetical protein